MSSDELFYIFLGIKGRKFLLNLVGIFLFLLIQIYFLSIFHFLKLIFVFHPLHSFLPSWLYFWPKWILVLIYCINSITLPCSSFTTTLECTVYRIYSWCLDGHPPCVSVSHLNSFPHALIQCNQHISLKLPSMRKEQQQMDKKSWLKFKFLVKLIRSH